MEKQQSTRNTNLSLQDENSFMVLTLAALGLLATAVVKGFSPESTLQLAGSSPGRIVLHLVCCWQDHRFHWHWRGIQREFIPSRRTGRP